MSLQNYRHSYARRRNIPTSENQALLPDDDRALRTLRYRRNTDLDPQLVWRSKDFDADLLEVATPPIYVQEKIQPRAIIEDLRRLTNDRRADAVPQEDLFRDFNGLSEGEARTEFYAHDQNWSNRMILGDSLLVMASLAEREALRGQVQTIYFDPPYGMKFSSNWQPSVRDRDSNTQTDRVASREVDVIRAFRDTWRDGISSYLSYLRDRFIASLDLLSPSGSIFVQISTDNAHLVASVLDEVFRRENQIAVIPFRKKTMPFGTNYIEQMADVILWYSKSKYDTKGRPTAKYRPLFRSLSEEPDSNFRYLETEYGQRRALSRSERDKWDSTAGSLYRLKSLEPSGPMESGRFRPVFQGTVFDHPRNGYAVPPEGMSRLIKAERIESLGRYLNYVLFKRDTGNLTTLTAPWFDTAGPSDKTYVVQTSRSVVERCMLMTTDPGDLVLDPTCGSGTTAYVAEQWGRRWITIDTSRVALTLARARLMGAKYDYYHLKDSEDGARKEGEVTGKPPVEGPFGQNIRHGFVYERAPHVTLKSIANNQEIDVIWERWQKTLEPLREKLNQALGRGADSPSPRSPDVSGLLVKDAEVGNTRLRAGEGREGGKMQAAGPHPSPSPTPPRKGEGLPPWQEWEIPREAGVAWPVAAREAHAAWWEARRARQKEIDDSIARNADVEYLYDRPYKARGVVRVAGPFTVESLSPHRVLPLGEDPYLMELLAAESVPSPSAGEGQGGGKDAGRGDLPPTPALPRKGGGSSEQTDFAEVVYENLKAAGVQNTKKGETLKFEWLRPFASRSGLIQFEGRYLEKGESKRAAVSIGPEYDTVGYELVRRAAREAADLFDTLIVCGFAFAPEVDDTRLNFGALTVLKARMNQDLRMGDKLKATGAGNLFVVFGEPDIVIHERHGDMLQMEIRGMDIFDPTTGEVRSSGGKDLMNDVAAWFVDHDYDEESFFVRQAYFVGDDPYDALKRALKAEIDDTAWAELNSTISRPFPRPKRGLICVKVINHFGDEVQKVFRAE